MPTPQTSTEKNNYFTPTDRLYRIVEEGACVGCGLCEAVAGPDRIQVRKVQTGYERPVVVGEINHELIDRIYDICPATRWDGMPEELIDQDTDVDLVWGPVKRSVLAHAGDPDVRWKAATGGILTALGMYLLDTQRVHFILHAKASPVQATNGIGTISENADSVRAGTSSIYSPTAPLRLVEDALSRDQPFAVIAKPCDIAALRNLAHYDKRVNRLVKYWLAPVCGGWTPPEMMKKFLGKRDLTWRDLSLFRHRGDGCPGECEFETKDGRRFSAPMNEPFTVPPEEREDESVEAKWILPYRCGLCPSGTGESADVVAADIRGGGEQKWNESHSNPGSNIVFMRTSAGQTLFESAVADGYINIEREMEPQEWAEHQDHLLIKKQVMRARFDGVAAEGQLVPRSVGLRLDANRQHISQETYDHEFKGTRRRIRNGRGAEPTPVADDDV